MRTPLLRRLWLVLTAVCALVASSCSSDGTAESEPENLVLLPGQGTLYLGAGPQIGAMDLYRLRGDGRSQPERLSKLAPGRNISAVTAGSGEVMVAEATEGTDKIARLVGDRLERVIDDRVFDPALSDDGRLAYVRLSEERGRPNEYAIVVHDLTTGTDRVAYETLNNVGGPAWGPGGALGFLEREPYPSYAVLHLVIVARDGGVRFVEAGHPKAGKILWSAAGPIALVHYLSPAGLLDPDSGRHEPLPAEWLPLTWSPDGRALLLARGRRLGILRPPNLRDVEDIGSTPEPVWNAAWVPAGERSPEANASSRPATTQTKEKP